MCVCMLHTQPNVMPKPARVKHWELLDSGRLGHHVEMLVECGWHGAQASSLQGCQTHRTAPSPLAAIVHDL